MPKLLWVALPLLLGAAWLGVQVLRGRTPSRHALNVGSSVLLLVYVLATAGLGIFWVANQQLPVFDWHYLFGYGTLLLVTLHLVFNFRVVWHFVRRPRRGEVVQAPVAARRAAPGRRGALGVLGAVLATGLAFALGLRQGRSSRRPDAAARPPGEAGVDAGAAALALVERFHAISSHSRAGVFLRAPAVDWGDAPALFKSYPGVARVVLPRPGRAGGDPSGVAALGTVLWHGTGVSEVRGGLQLRASPSSGALFPAELYVVTRDVPGLAPGVWHYDARGHALERLGGGTAAAATLEVEADPGPAGAAALVVATAVFRRTGYKYGDRTYRYVLADIGHTLENLRVTAAAMGTALRFVAAFDEARTAVALGIDAAEEGVLALAAWHADTKSGTGRDEAASDPPVGSRWQASPPAADHAAPLGVTAAVHAATSLQAATRRAGSAPAAAAPDSLPADAVLLPRVAPSASDVLQVIATRRSVRRFARTPLRLEALAGVLAHMAGPDPVWSPAVRVDVVVHDVEAVAPGSYRYDPAHRALLPRRRGADRSASRGAALDQDVIGDAAVAFVLSIDRRAFATDPLGAARGYRHAFLEAGLVGERIYLEAGARGLGACAVGAFYDAEAAALVGIDPAREWIVHFAGLGVPAR